MTTLKNMYIEANHIEIRSEGNLVLLTKVVKDILQHLMTPSVRGDGELDAASCAIRDKHNLHACRCILKDIRAALSSTLNLDPGEDLFEGANRVLNNLHTSIRDLQTENNALRKSVVLARKHALEDAADRCYKWGMANRDTFMEQALAAETCAKNIKDSI